MPVHPNSIANLQKGRHRTFKSGKDWTGNPGGKSKLQKEIAALKRKKLRETTEADLLRLQEIGKDKNLPGMDRVEALSAMLEKGFGKTNRRPRKPSKGPSPESLRDLSEIARRAAEDICEPEEEEPREQRRSTA